MINPKLIKKRVDSIRNIGKITKALEMVSASKIQKAQEKAISAKPYARQIYRLIAGLSGDSETREIPLMRQPEAIRNSLYILISTNRGLAGSLNTNLIRAIGSHLEGKSTPAGFITIGKKGRYFAASHGSLQADFSAAKNPVQLVSSITKIVIEEYVKESYDEVYIVYSDFVSALEQTPAVKQILPITRDMLSKEGEIDPFTLSGTKESVSGPAAAGLQAYYYEPSPVEVLTSLLPYYLEIQLAESLYEAEASEHSARMVAMKNASDSAGELTDSLSLEYNKARQSMITTEINDITTAQSALK